MIRITGGSLRGRPLKQPVPRGVRPTAARVREALFSMLGQDLDGLELIDPFCGSGCLSFEALSRGAKQALLLDKSPRSLQAARAQAAALGLSERVRLRRAQLPRQLPEGSWDLALVDPPYDMDPTETLLALAPRIRWRLVLEQSARESPPELPGGELIKERRFGDTLLSIYGFGRSPVER